MVIVGTTGAVCLQVDLSAHAPPPYHLRARIVSSPSPNALRSVIRLHLLLALVARSLLYEVSATQLAILLASSFPLPSAQSPSIQTELYILGYAYFMKLSSSLLFALSGGPCCSSLGPPRSASHEPTKVVPRVAIASWSCIY
jgi:hypothetical protein